MNTHKKRKKDVECNVILKYVLGRVVDKNVSHKEQFSKHAFINNSK